ncbi:hypothetical protein EYC84_010099 [Monilinia fructicola]|uniref:Uncharacterized protein n=1 Tax=Monilinia fructicola TaxID=38448 RepID=A0A5M9JGS8_MONFR|nr:hypothetical protein EYC84_010099 [Monilinia fructicola]
MDALSIAANVMRTLESLLNHITMNGRIIFGNQCIYGGQTSILKIAYIHAIARICAYYCTICRETPGMLRKTQEMLFEMPGMRTQYL